MSCMYFTCVLLHALKNNGFIYNYLRHTVNILNPDLMVYNYKNLIFRINKYLNIEFIFIYMVFI